MALPKAVQQQVENADRMVAELNGTPPANADTGAPATPVAAATVSQEQPVQKPVSEETWEARFHTLQGKYNAEVPRQAQQIRELNSVVQTLVAENAAIKTPPAAPVQAAPIVTDAEREAFGGDLVDLVGRVAQQTSEQARAEAERIRSENEQLRKQVNDISGQVAAGAKDRFMQQLSAAVPDWQAVNTDHGFLAWLGETDPVYGLPRQAGLDHAYQNLDAGRVAQIFERYKALSETTRTPQQSLQSQVAPSSSRAGTQVNTDPLNGRIWTNAEIAPIYQTRRLG